MLKFSVYHLLKKTNEIFSLPNRLKISLPKDKARGYEIYDTTDVHIASLFILFQVFLIFFI